MVSYRPQGAGLRCECVFFYLIKGPCFVTHRILRSKSNTYYMQAAAGYRPAIPGRFVEHVQAHKNMGVYNKSSEFVILARTGLRVCVCSASLFISLILIKNDVRVCVWFGG